MKLTDKQIQSAKPKEKLYKLSDGHGLQLAISPAGSKTWQVAYAGGQKTLTIGKYPYLTLASAREKLKEVKEAERAKVDPRAALERNRHTFAEVANSWFETKKSGWKTSYSKRLWSRLQDNILPVIGNMDVSEVQPMQVLTALKAVEEREALTTARRVLALTSQVFMYAIAHGWASNNPTHGLVKLLKPLPRVKHRAALTSVDLPLFLSKLYGLKDERITAYALKFTTLTFARTDEIRFATWAEIEGLNGPEALWRIPAERMKQHREHLVPLAPQAVQLLRDLKAEDFPGDFLFPSYGKKGVLSENAMLYMMYRLGFHSKATVHGLRGTASTVLNESGHFNPEWIELQLSHDDRDQIRSAYNSAKHLKSRREMMVWWANYLDRARDSGDLL